MTRIDVTDTVMCSLTAFTFLNFSFCDAYSIYQNKSLAAAEAVACARTCISDGETIIDSIDGDCLRVCLASLEATGNCVVNDLYGDDPINVGIDFPVGDVDFWPNGGSM